MSTVSRSVPTFSTADPTDFWLGLATDHPDLVFATLQRFETLAAATVLERERAIAALLDFEAGLPDEELRGVLGAELRALTALPEPAARMIIDTIDAFQRSRPAAFSMRRTVALQGACRDLTLEEIGRIETLLPNARELAGLPAFHMARPGAAAAPVIAETPQPRRWSRLFSRP
jgi:hypothetical protein